MSDKKVSPAAARFFMEQCIGESPGRTPNIVLSSFLKCHMDLYRNPDEYGVDFHEDRENFCKFLREVAERLDPA